MRTENETITLKGDDALDALKEIEYILISLRDIGRYYYLRPSAPPTSGTSVEYALETTRFIDDNGICSRLAKVRSILSSTFDDELGSDQMDDIERAVQNLKYWRKPGD
jgi:hypothetical protein